ncbi:hypothetical protein CL629_00380 [bacterium]|nr:hypothetical protein [bacterium]
MNTTAEHNPDHEDIPDPDWPCEEFPAYRSNPPDQRKRENVPVVFVAREEDRAAVDFVRELENRGRAVQLLSDIEGPTDRMWNVAVFSNGSLSDWGRWCRTERYAKENAPEWAQNARKHILVRRKRPSDNELLNWQAGACCAARRIQKECDGMLDEVAETHRADDLRCPD